MTLSTTTSRNDYTGSDSVGTYAYSYRIFSATDLSIKVRNIASGVETTLVNGTDYTVDSTTIGNIAGGNITLVNGNQAWLASGTAYLSSAYKLSIRRVRPVSQGTDLRNQGEYFAEIHEDTFDSGIMVSQQQQDDIDRSIKLPDTVPSTDFSPELPANIADKAGMAIVVNDAGDGFTLGPVASTGVSGTHREDTMANLQAYALAHPTTSFYGYATDYGRLFFYTGNTSVGDNGFIQMGG